MFKNYRFGWEDPFLLLLFAFGAVVLVSLGTCIYKPKFTHQYSLGDKDGTLTITKEIDWCEDDEIELDRSVTYWEAIRMVDSLNKTLKP